MQFFQVIFEFMRLFRDLNAFWRFSSERFLVFLAHGTWQRIDSHQIDFWPYYNWTILCKYIVTKDSYFKIENATKKVPFTHWPLRTCHLKKNSRQIVQVWHPPRSLVPWPHCVSEAPSDQTHRDCLWQECNTHPRNNYSSIISWLITFISLIAII